MFQAHPQQHQRQSPVKPTDKCYKCGKPGHWAYTCPENPNNRSPISLPINSDQQFPATHCLCGGGHCEILISKSINNPNRKYYACPGKNGMHCGYFKWCDKLIQEGNVMVVQPKPYPVCGCGAGVCTLVVEQNGVNAGRSYFVCRIKKGDGACNFIQWLDNSPESQSITSSNPVACHSASLYDFDFSIEVAMQLDAIEMLARTPSKDVVHVESDEEEIQGEAWLPIETPEVHLHLGMNNILKNPDFEMIIQSGDTLNNHMHSSPVGDMQTSHTKVVPVLNKGILEGAQPWVVTFPNPPSPLKDNLHEGNSMTSTTLEDFGNFALQLQNKLITSLESTNPHSYETMTKEANSTFSALNCLRVDYELFHSKVVGYIKQASSLAHIEQIINVGTSPGDLVTHRDNEQRRFDELVKAHQEALDAYNASNNHFSILCAKASVFNSPSELTKKLSTCRAEIAYRQETLLKITETLAECKESLQAASQKAEKALKESEMRGMEWSEAQAAFQKARAQLRN